MPRSRARSRRDSSRSSRSAALPNGPSIGISPSGLGPSYPNAREFGEFAKAIARRFGGGFDGLPRVRYWQVWNEPNLSPDLLASAS